MFLKPLLVPVALALHLSWVQAQQYPDHHDHQAILNSQNNQPEETTAAQSTKRVAIIGAGAAGSSAAYHLRQYANAAGIPMNISIFEKNGYIGGRSTTVWAYDDPDANEPVELGASIFVEVNHILMKAVEDFDLPIKGFFGGEKTGKSTRRSDDEAHAMGIWNGEEIVFKIKDSMSWTDYGKLFWRYGLAPLKARSLMKEVVGKFEKMYDEPVFPWKSLSNVVYQLGLSPAVTGVTGEEYLKEKGIGELFSREIIQASTRVNYAQNLNAIHGVETMVCMATDGAMAIAGGNWRIFTSMAHAATPHTSIHLNTTVLSITREADGTYTLTTTTSKPSSSSPSSSVLTTTTSIFDILILAAPLQFTNLTIHPSPRLHTPSAIPYVHLHVTLFTTPYLLSPLAFNLPPTTPVPQTLLTTLQPSESPGSGPAGVGEAGFFSISVLREVENRGTGGREYLYKIFSPHRVEDEFLSSILGRDISSESEVVDPATEEEETPEPEAQARHRRAKTGQTKSRKPISWLHRHAWHSYPYETPRTVFDEAQLDDDFWYTAGIEGFISTMETSALMGKNVARLVVDGWEAEGMGGSGGDGYGDGGRVEREKDKEAKTEL
ncbi:Prenylcysteine oxidase [Aulographum hederae CBS 113979]|uniref:Prenylcysteine oxidase n=1 Tax=Aulographum hederae CBS 113979 TaxID=1176131 RepID=A0A6G1GTH3_9PEZI|nr:Prenylcysteine oxidase [Aulographum hederae CBS 113979]